jgi:cobalt-zinc-cadmium efflux system protein
MEQPHVENETESGNGHVHAHVHGVGEEHDEGGRRGVGGFTPGEARQARRLTLVLSLVGAFFVLELGGALVAESVVLQADALHLLMDVFALGVSLLAMRLAVRRPTPRFTYGLRRAEPVAAIFSAGLVLATTVGIVVEALAALHERTEPKPGVMLVVAVAALVVNGASAWLLHDALEHSHGHAADPDNPDDPGQGPDGHDGHDGHPAHDDHDHEHGHTHAHGRKGKADGHTLNLRGAWLHLLGDTLGAVAAVAAALLIRFGGARMAWADPVASFAVAAILLVGALRLLHDATLVLLEAAPPHLSVESIRAVISEFPGVEGVHDLHVWTLGAGHDAITVHVLTSSRDQAFARRLAARIRSVLGAEYVTVQAEPGPNQGDA